VSGPAPRETILQALLDAMTFTLGGTFVADTEAGSPVLMNVRDITADTSDLSADSDLTVDIGAGGGLLMGFPIFGGSFPAGSVITLLSPLTLSLPASQTQTGVEFISGIQTAGRRVRLAASVAAQPAVFVRGADEDMEWSNTVLSEQLIRAEIWLYSNAGSSPSVAPETMINWLCDGVQYTAMAPDDPMSGRFTLEGLVFWCRLRRIMKQSGDIDGQAMAVIDVDIIVP
jgi:hypothetical protein